MAGDPAAYAAKPSQLPNPVPGADAQASFADFAASAKLPQAPAAAAPPAGAAPSGGDDSFAAFAQGASGAPAPDATPGAAPAPTPAPVPSGQVDMGAELSDSWKKIKDMFSLPRGEMVKKMRENIAQGSAPASDKWLSATILNNTLAMPEQMKNLKMASLVNEGATQKEKFGVLAKQVGKENVQVGDDGSLNFRYPGEKEFRPLAPAGFEIFNDTVGNTRQLGKEAVLFPAEALAAWASGGNPYVVTGTRALLQGPANYIMDKVSEADAGVEHDQMRSRLVENLIDTGVEAGAGIILHKIAQAVPGTDSYAKSQARKAINEVNLMQQSKDLLADEQHLSASGIFQEVPGAMLGPEFQDQSIKFRADQIFPNDSNVMRKTSLAKDSAPFQNIQNAQVDNVVNMTENLFAKVAQYTGNDANATAERIGSIAQGLESAEGKAIGQFKAKAMQNLGNSKVPLSDDLKGQISQLASRLGFTPVIPEGAERVGYARPTTKQLQDLADNLGVASVPKLRAFTNILGEFLDKSSDGGMRIQDIEALMPKMKAAADIAERNGMEASAVWGKIMGSFRDYRRQAVMAGLPSELDQRGFSAVMDKFSQMRGASDTLKRTLEGDFTSNAIVQQVFNRGQSGLANLRAIKTLVTKDSPETWAALKQSWVDDMFRRYSTPGGATPYNFSGMQKELGSYGSSFLDEAFEGSGVSRKDVQALMNVAQNVQSTYRRAGAPMSLDEKTKQGVFNSLVGAMSGMHFKVVNGLQQALGVNVPGNPLHDILNPRDLATRLSNYNGTGSKSVIEKNVKKLIATARASAILPTALHQANFAVRNFSKQGLKNQIAPAGNVAPSSQQEEPEGP